MTPRAVQFLVADFPRGVEYAATNGSYDRTGLRLFSVADSLGIGRSVAKKGTAADRPPFFVADFPCTGRSAAKNRHTIRLEPNGSVAS